VRIRMTALILAFAAMCCGGAVAQYNGIGDCEHFATTLYKAKNADFKSFVIDRNTVNEIGFDDNVGSQHVTAIYRGLATYTDVRRKITGTFICLHAGPGKSAVFIHLIPR